MNQKGNGNNCLQKVYLSTQKLQYLAENFLKLTLPAYKLSLKGQLFL